jgi:hypothetical protein
VLHGNDLEATTPQRTHSGKLAGLAYFWHKLPKLVGADVSGSYLSTPIEDCSSSSVNVQKPARHTIPCRAALRQTGAPAAVRVARQNCCANKVKGSLHSGAWALQADQRAAAQRPDPAARGTGNMSCTLPQPGTAAAAVPRQLARHPTRRRAAQGWSSRAALHPAPGSQGAAMSGQPASQRSCACHHRRPLCRRRRRGLGR